MRIPEGVREVIGRRLNRLTERCNQVLTIGAVIGREFELRQVERLVEDPSSGSGQRTSSDRLLEVLEEALGARVIEELPQFVSRYQFSHALIQQTLYDELTTTRRVRLHARIAEVLEDLYGEEAEAHARELAYHFGEAHTVLGTARLVKYSQLTADRAMEAYAWEEAIAHLNMVLEHGEGQSMAQTGELLDRLWRAQAALDLRDEAIATMSRAFDCFAETGDVGRAVAIAGFPFPVWVIRRMGPIL